MMFVRMATILALVAGLQAGTVEAQAPDCDPAKVACFDVRIDLPVEVEPKPREGYERPNVNRYQTLEKELYRQLRMDFTPYTCTRIGGEAGLASRNGQGGTDIEHIVALAEAYDSGLSNEDLIVFSSDPANLTLATPHENRTVKSAHDAAGYLPEHNACWFAGRVVRVKEKWELSVDPREAMFLKTALARCTAAEIARPSCDKAGEGSADEERAAAHPPIQGFRNCGLMHEAGWTRGVKRQGGTYQDAWDAAEIETYQLNLARDRDRDGWACEG